MFEFVVTYLGFFKRVPLMAQLFDALLKIETFFFNREILDYIDDIETEVLSWSNTSVHVHKFGGIQFNLGNEEIGHIHGNGLLDVLFDRKIKSQLLVEGKVSDHHTFKKSGWITFRIESEVDKQYALDLLKYSITTSIKQ
jgi:Family of unknown function (DUF5519)